jgi:two-component sensor histidine kinase
MMADGTYPDFSNPTGPRRGAPRANDGLLRLDEEGVVSFASPNGLSAFNRLGIVGELEGKVLADAATPVLKNRMSVDESLPLVLTGRAPWRTDMESANVTLTVRAIPLREGGHRTGAIVLCRDVTELRRQERELITKDATIREIHHRVKNNLQTVASLLRIQARRSKSDETRESLNQAMRRVSAIALVHDTLSEGLNQDVNFDEVFDRVLMLATEVAASIGTSVKTLIDGKFGQLKSDLATPLAVALTEIVTNAVEHGLAERSGVVAVNAERKQKQLLITVSDNGKGLEGGKVGVGLGTQIIRTLIEGELRGSIHWSSPHEGGTRVAIAIPLA